MTPATLPPRIPFGGVDEYPHLDPIVTWEEVRTTGAVLRCRYNARLAAMLERSREPNEDEVTGADCPYCGGYGYRGECDAEPCEPCGSSGRMTIVGAGLEAQLERLRGGLTHNGEA